MKISELKAALLKNPKATIRFLLPNGEFIPAHAHVTEVALIEKRFIDCGGTFRENSFCRLQTWVADDLEHRLVCEKLSKILDKAQSILLTDELEVDVEHQLEFISQFPLQALDVKDMEVVLRLSQRNTACLAPEKCCPAQEQLISFIK